MDNRASKALELLNKAKKSKAHPLIIENLEKILRIRVAEVLEDAGLTVEDLLSIDKEE